MCPVSAFTAGVAPNVTPQGRHLGSRCRVPQLHRVVPAPGSQSLAVRSERNRGHAASVTLQRVQNISSCHVND
eukprot:1869796-Rhodomonas_salina.1